MDEPPDFFKVPYTTCTWPPPLTADSILSMLHKMKVVMAARPKPLDVICATPGGSERLKLWLSVPAIPGQRPDRLSGIPIVELPTVAECQDACEKSINAGKRAAVLTEYNFMDPIEAAREAML